MAGEYRPDINDPKAFVYYRYHPSLIAAAIFAGLFGISTLLHIFQMFKKRSWFLIPFIIGGCFEIVGYVGRVQSSNDQWAPAPYIMQTLVLLLAPALLAASIYMILGRIIHLTDGEKFAPVRRTWLTKIFVGGDVISFMIQSAGGSIMSNAKTKPSNLKLGEHIIIIGLFAQLAFFGFFVVAGMLYQIRGREHLAQVPAHIPWKRHLYTLYITSTAILIRSVFRVIEFFQGNAGFLLRKEVFLYVFDAALMLLVLAIMNIAHPGDIARLLKEKSQMGTEFGHRGNGRNKNSEYSSMLAMA